MRWSRLALEPLHALRVIGKPTITADVTEGVKLALGHHLLGALAVRVLSDLVHHEVDGLGIEELPLYR